MSDQPTTRSQSRSYQLGDGVRFTNQWGQRNQFALVMNQDGDTLTVCYLGCMHEITLADLD